MEDWGIAAFSLYMCVCMCVCFFSLSLSLLLLLLAIHLCCTGLRGPLSLLALSKINNALRCSVSVSVSAAINSYLFAVMSTYKDPFPGWTDNLYGPSGLCTWSARGLVRCIYGTANCKANMVPADYVVNAMIATAWDIARRLVLDCQRLGCLFKCKEIEA